MSVQYPWVERAGRYKDQRVDGVRSYRNHGWRKQVGGGAGPMGGGSWKVEVQNIQVEGASRGAGPVGGGSG